MTADAIDLAYETLLHSLLLDPAAPVGVTSGPRDARVAVVNDICANLESPDLLRILVRLFGVAQTLWTQAIEAGEVDPGFRDRMKAISQRNSFAAWEEDIASPGD